MVTKKTTITLDEDQLDRIRHLVSSGKAGVTFDAGGLIVLDCGDRRVIVLPARAAESGALL